MKVVFLDRDGIINQERGDYTWKKQDFEFTEGLFEALKTFSENGFVLMVITNQGGIDKGLYSHSAVRELHQWMVGELGKRGIELRDIFYCPHHSDFQKCLCRKPGSLLLEKAVATYHIDKGASFMIGDRQRDVEAAESIGIRGILLESNPNWSKLNLESMMHG